MHLLPIATVLLAVAVVVPASDWPRFRGAQASGVAIEIPVPTEMTPEAGFIWKREIPAGKSSAVLWGERLFLTAHEGERLLTLAFDRRTGETLWTRRLQRTRVDKRNPVNDAAVPTPVTDGHSLYVFFADFGLAAYTVEGRELWRRPLGPFTSPHGVAASPLLINGVLVLGLEQLHNGEIIGVDATTGELKWSVPRPASIGGSFSTPVAYRDAAVVMSPFELAAYDPQTGNKLWRVGGLAHQPKSSPMVVDDVILAGIQGDNARGNLKTWEKTVADLDKDGSGVVEAPEIRGALADYDGDGVFGRNDYEQWFVEKSPESRLIAVRDGEVLWSVDRGVPRVTTPLAYQGVVYLMRNSGILSAFDLETGALLKEGRLRDAVDEYFASPVAADGKVLVNSRSCQLTWIEAGRDWQILQTSALGEECFATPALAHDGIFVRTSGHLYRFAAQ